MDQTSGDQNSLARARAADQQSGGGFGVVYGLGRQPPASSIPPPVATGGAAVWDELEAAKRSALYHLGQAVEYRSRAARENGADGADGADEADGAGSRLLWPTTPTAPPPDLVERIRNLPADSGGGGDRNSQRQDLWRLKAETDKAARDLQTMRIALDTLVAAHQATSPPATAAVWPALSIVAYALRGRLPTAVALAFDLVVTCGSVRAAAPRLVPLLRRMALRGALGTVHRLRGRVAAYAVDADDCASLGRGWFRVLGWVRVKVDAEAEAAAVNQGGGEGYLAVEQGG